MPRTGPDGRGPNGSLPPALDRFELLEEVGSGGFGTVWRARDTRLGRVVALKVPHQTLRGALGQLERCRREARAAAQLRHPGVVTVHEVAEFDGLPVLVCDFVTGGSLRDLVRSRRLAFREAAALVAEVAEAVDYAHGMGLVHRDLKPANILLEAAGGGTIGRPLVTDFGLARREDVDATLTQEGEILGTPAYMSPEQAAGRGHEVDRRSDVYSLGVILYELFTGRLPFSGSAAALVRQVLADEPAPPRKLAPDLPRDLETVCLKAMAKEPARRYQTARDLADDLRRWLGDEPVRARPAGRVERAWRWCRRNRWVAGLTAAVFVLLLAVTATAVWAAFQADARARAEADARNELAFNLYLRNIPRAQEEALRGDWGEAEVLLGAIDRDCPERLRGWEYDYLRRLPDAPLREATGRVSGGISANLDLAFSPDGRLLAAPGPREQAGGGSRETVTVWDLTTGEQRYLPRHAGRPGHTAQVLCVAFRPPDGGLLASAGKDGRVRFWNPATGEPVGEPLTAHDGKSIDGLAFSPDGRLLATIGADEKVRLWDVGTGPKKRAEFDTVYKKHARMLRRVAFSPDGRFFAYGGAGNTVRVWDVAAGEEKLSLPGHKDLVYAVEFSPQGDRLVSTSWDLTAKVWDLTTPGGRELFFVRGHSSAAWSAAFSPDGALLAAAGGISEPTVKVYDARTGQLRHTLAGHADRVGCVTFHPGGRRLASCSLDQTIRIWELDQGREVLTLRGHRDLVTRVLFDPKGRWLASSTDGGALRVWDGTPPGQGPGRPCVTLPGHTRKVFALAFSPDGRGLASAGQDGTVRVWDVAAAREVHTLHGHADTVFVVRLDSDGRLLSGSYDGTVRLWDSRSGRLLDKLSGPETRVRSLATSADGRYLATSSITPPFDVWLWDLRRGENGFRIEKRPAPLEGHNGPAFGLAFSPDGRSVATAGTDGQVILWESATGRRQGSPLIRPGSRERAWSVAFRPPHGRQLAAGYSGNLVITWDLDSGKERLLTGHTKDVYAVAYSPDGRWLASASWSEVILWDAETGNPVRKIDGYRGLIWAVAWSPDRPLLAVAGGRDGVGTIELWDVSDLPARAAAVGSGQ